MTPKADFYAGIGIAIFSAVFFIIGGTYNSSQGQLGLGRGGFPQIISGIMFVLGAMLSINSFIAIRKGAKSEKKLSKPELIRMLLLIIAFAAYLFVMKYLGYIITTPPFLFLFLYLYGDRKWVRMAIVSVCTTVVTFFLFNNVFMILLPGFNIYF